MIRNIQMFPKSFFLSLKVSTEVNISSILIGGPQDRVSEAFCRFLWLKKKTQIQKATLSQINRRPLSNYLHACSMCCTFSLIILIQYFLAYFRHSNRRCWRRKTPDFPLCVTDDLIISFCLMTVWQSWIWTILSTYM